MWSGSSRRKFGRPWKYCLQPEQRTPPACGSNIARIAASRQLAGKCRSLGLTGSILFGGLLSIRNACNDCLCRLELSTVAPSTIPSAFAQRPLATNRSGDIFWLAHELDRIGPLLFRKAIRIDLTFVRRANERRYDPVFGYVQAAALLAEK